MQVFSHNFIPRVNRKYFQLATERSYVGELASLLEFYIDPFEASNANGPLRGRSQHVFGTFCLLQVL